MSYLTTKISHQLCADPASVIRVPGRRSRTLSGDSMLQFSVFLFFQVDTVEEKHPAAHSGLASL